MNGTRWLLLLSSLALAACGGEETPGTCSPVGFVSCDGNDLVTCTGEPDAASGTPVFVDCTASAQFCLLGEGPASASCGPAVLGEPCFGRNTQGCGASDRLLRCVWVNEVPEPGVSGDVGIWRVQTDCAATGGACPIPAAACTHP